MLLKSLMNLTIVKSVRKTAKSGY